MSKQTIDVIVEGGKAVAGATLGQSLGPLGVNIQEILKVINEKTQDLKGMKVPVKIIVDIRTKNFEIEIGTPPTSELIKKELGLEKGSAQPDKMKVGNIAIEQIIKIAKIKRNSMHVNTLKSAVKSIIGSCGTLGILVESKNILEINEEVNNGVYDKEIKLEKTDVSEEKKELLKQQLVEVQEKIRIELEKLAKEAEAEEKPKEEVKEEKAEGEEKAVGEAAAEEKKPGKEDKKPKEEKKEEKFKEKKK